jgi:hypothetical protein
MARRQKDESSTERLQFAFGLRSMARPIVPFVAEALGIEAKLEVVERTLRDEQAIAARLARVPAPALGMLEMLVDAGGQMESSLLRKRCLERLGMNDAHFAGALEALWGEGLAVQLSSDGEDRFMGLVDVSAGTIARHVSGLTLPPVPADLPRGSMPSALRDYSALLASLASFAVRANQDGRANLTSCKKLATTTGLPAEQVTAVLDSAVLCRLVRSDGTRLRPIVSRLRAFARGEVDLSAGYRPSIVAALPADRWVPREAVVRAMERELQSWGLGMFLVRPRYDPRPEAEASVDAAALERVERDGHVFVRRPSRRGPVASGDGHVTPSFEVMLGPDADPELTATVSLATEPLRFDRVLTRRITPASITAARALGLDVEEITDALAKVGPHGVPDNVRAMVNDWVRSARLVRAQRVWALEASSPAAADAAARALGERVVSRPSPTVVLVGGGDSDPSSVLSAAGVECVLAPAGVPVEDAQPAFDSRELDARGDPALRARFEAERVSGLAALAGLVREEVLAASPADTIVARLQSGPRPTPAERRFAMVAEQLWRAAFEPYKAWAEALPEASADSIAYAIAVPFDFIPWLVLGPGPRARLLAASSSVGELLEAAMRVPPARHSKIGGEAIRLMRDPNVQSWVFHESGANGEEGDWDGELDFAGDWSEESAGDEQVPLASELPSQPPEVVQQRFADAARKSTPVWLRVRSKSQGDRVVRLVPERVLTRGKDVALLGMDADDEQSRSFPLANVIAVEPC